MNNYLFKNSINTLKSINHIIKRNYLVVITPENTLKDALEKNVICKDCDNYINKKCKLFGILNLINGTYEHCHADTIRETNCINGIYFKKRENLFKKYL
jgi:hypothetical protein